MNLKILHMFVKGDILIIFSQYGIPVHLKLIRDKETGKSRGFGYLKYEDQRSTILAVDNLNGAKVLGRIIRVNHTFFEERDRDEEYENLLKEELQNDFAELENEQDINSQKTDEKDDEFQDPLLLMEKDKKDEGSKSKSRSRRDHHHSHSDKHRHSHRSRSPSRERPRRHRSKSREHRHDDKDKRDYRSRSHRHRSSKEKEDHKNRDDSNPKENEDNNRNPNV
ncbi:U11/U12 small nuclear ribonucleoprotein 35 kDa protein [Wickerhamomyces ciferrii]|uniref:U11/U12 small nuclear ribonucleoprotein 35 kDa protein n=1 Tax=Wickerhamomyces ciferrii (strain ATCC 14091 / BCRC 22168 / CBS 111 / JCM 3599 / NBRC 0793 / NRRL Y-1031 F-60-10) TaxID=1206466 RepID=K0K9J9_WICCF|nr:U11/U12 small nuclear ribonucleoprotein 35 kDa protein [Wickerhamomyces ciferrii]CCH41590.1 U11/U12 small nuclear ribonucleoprotein 35 kDa protein [Wickerhamomyces ciferrii]